MGSSPLGHRLTERAPNPIFLGRGSSCLCLPPVVGWMENAPHRLMNTRTVVGVVMGSFGGGTLLEEEHHHWGSTLSVYSPASLPAHSLLPACAYHVIGQLPGLLSHPHPLEPKATHFFLKLLLAMVLYNTKRKGAEATLSSRKVRPGNLGGRIPTVCCTSPLPFKPSLCCRDNLNANRSVTAASPSPGLVSPSKP